LNVNSDPIDKSSNLVYDVSIDNKDITDDPLIDPDTGKELPGLREQVSQVKGISYHFLCYVRVLQPCGDGLYWADVAATPDFVNS